MLVAQVGSLVHLVALLRPQLGKSGAAYAVAATAMAAMLGQIGLGLIIDRLDQRRVSAWPSLPLRDAYRLRPPRRGCAHEVLVTGHFRKIIFIVTGIGRNPARYSGRTGCYSLFQFVK